MANASTTVTVTLMTDLDKPLRAYLIAAGWTPPGETPHPAGDWVSIAEHSRIYGQRAERHNAAMRNLRQRHLIELDRQAKNHDEELRRHEARVRAEYSAGGGHDDCVSRSVYDQELRDHAKHIRSIVANEIADDMERRSWSLTNEDPAPWVKVARSHAGLHPDLSFPTGGIPWATTAGEKP